MLELKYYSVQEIQNLKDFFLVAYVIINHIYYKIIPDHIRFRHNYSESKLSDSPIITIAIVGEIHSISSKKATYYGLKLHAAVNLDGYLVDFELTAANVDDRTILWELLSDAYQPIVLGDKGYII